MAGYAGSRRVTYLVLRYMRRPILVLVAVYSISMLGWVMIPGSGPDGARAPMSFFHAFYFLTYSATTTGFGEIPYPFSEAQRMWATISLYAGVVAWLYAVGAIVQLVQNPHFRQATAELRFAKAVARLQEPFVIVCGFGNRGSLLTRGLSDSGLAAVIVDASVDRISAVHLRDYRVPTPALCADARFPARLIDAGLTNRHCRAVVAMTNDEDVNVKISVASRLLNPRVRVVTQSTQDVHDQTLSTLGADVHVVDPFETYARYLAATIRNPLIHMLNEWLIGSPGANLAMYPEIPRGTWILCGFGRMGHWFRSSLESVGIETIVIDPTIDEEEEAGVGRVIVARASRQTLREAGIERAAGILAGTDSDSDNLSIALNARALNPDIFVLVRQNLHRNQVLFSAAEADLIMQPTLVAARRTLCLLIAPLLGAFFRHLRELPMEAGHEFLMDAVRQLRDVVGGTRPRLWITEIDDETTAALMELLRAGQPVALGDVLRDPGNRDERLGCVPMVLRSGSEVTVMPDLSHPLRPIDQILFCGRNHAYHLLESNLNNPYTLHYLITGIDAPRSLVTRWLIRKLSGNRKVAVG